MPSTSIDSKSLALKLLRADSEDEVVRILKSADLWDNADLWRLYGDKEGNFAQAGNQQSLPEAALVEKVVNCCDSRLMRECLLRDINPESSDAPRSVREAVAAFFESRKATGDEGGSLAVWGSAKRSEESKNITIAATGDRPARGQRRKRMCLTIVDRGEGQSPKRLPRTILSLNAKNKQRIRFVQGKFNMGGSGALRFCGQQGLQLVISRRDPRLAERERSEDRSNSDWAVTVVRREAPTAKSGEPVHSEFTYLAPIGVGAGAQPRSGEVLRFSSESLPLMPEHDEPYSREIEWGTAIKLYEFQTSVGQSNVLMKDGLLYALERLLPEIALPVRMHECRGYEGVKERSFETPLAGLVVRLEEGRGDNLETGFPLSSKIRAGSMEMLARIYAFREDKADTYLSGEGVIFTINGQAHGNLPKSLFSRPKAVGLPRLRDSLLVLVDCSSLEVTQREDLFMSSRDRLSKNRIRMELEEEIEQMLRENSVLRRLQQERRASDVETKLSEEKPLEEVLEKVLKSSPNLKNLFLQGQRLARPFARTNGDSNGNGPGPNPGATPFKGRRHPTFFKHATVDYGKLFERNCEKDRRVRVKFLTDAENSYFNRTNDKGRFDIEILDASYEAAELNYNFTLEDGEAHLNMALPAEADIGDSLTFQTMVSDPTLPEPFINLFRVHVQKKQEKPSGPSKPKPPPPGGGGTGAQQNESGLAMPKVIIVRENDDRWRKHKFTPGTACHVESDPVEGSDQEEHTFYINLDNTALKTEMKYSKQDPRLLEAKFKYGNVLLGLGMLHADGLKSGEQKQEGKGQDRDDSRDGSSGGTVQDEIRRVSSAVAPVLIPMIDQLGGLNEDDLEVLSSVGEDG